jgi:serine/threonine protein kinase/tetratricopeptide (TPR) repeat protein
MIGKEISHYKIIEKLGEGGMGEVYLAEDTELKRKVALKFLPAQVASEPDALARFKREAQAAAALNHPNIITVYEVGRHEDQTFIAMAYIDGDQLSDALIDGISVERAVDVAIQVGEGLDKAHQAGIVHRDVKPDNLIIDKDGRVKILDFGIALFEDVGTSVSESSTVGTIHYMSPEQAREEETDARSDIFSLGAILYEILAGRRPFKGDHSAAVQYSILNEDPAPLSAVKPKISPELERITAKALAKDLNERYQSAAELVADLKAFQSGAAQPSKEKIPVRRFAIPGVLLLIALILLFVTDPFNIMSSSTQDAEASDDVLAIMYFDNLAQQGDPQRLGEIITNLLITNLSQSQDLKVVSSQRLYDILKMQGKEGAKNIDRSTATEIAQTTGARWMMLGSILQVDPHLIITSQLVDVTTGNIEASQRLTGAPGETVFDLVDQMTGETRTELAVPVRLDVEEPVSVVDVTTSSLDAYRHYLEGLEYRYKYYGPEAGESFRKAIELDSTFAMAHYWYAFNALNSADFRAAMSAINKAMQYSGHVSEKERLYIESLKAVMEFSIEEAAAKLTQITENYPDEKEAFLWLGRIYRPRDYEKALGYYEKIVEMDPLHKRSYNEMSYLYDDMGNFEKSIWAINQYIALAPDEANPYDSRGDLYARNGDIDNALASYQKATEIKPDYYASVSKLGNMHLFKGDYEKAESQYKKLVSSDQPNLRSTGRGFPAFIHAYQGRFEEAIEALEISIAADEMEDQLTDAYAGKFLLRGMLYSELGQNDRAITDVEQAAKIAKEAYPTLAKQIDLNFCNSWAATGRVAYAESILASYDSVLDTLDLSMLVTYHGAKGMVAWLKDDLVSAGRHAETADSLAPNNYMIRFLLSQIYVDDQRFDEAIQLLENMLNRYTGSRLQYPPFAARGYYLLGMAYQQAGRNEDAVEQFQMFLEIWKNADPELEDISDAKKRLQELGRSS